ncbi:MAG: oligosaccharide flippase family protein [Saccharofermentans sp.]|nr:oligosaccharide flippase family protein [Saccharofermentans sp.]
MRKKKAIVNIIFSLLVELVTVISGLIVPRLIIGTFGSDVNGMIGSITSFVAYISLLQTGVGSAVKAALYKPLAKKNHEQLCVIVKTSNIFFRKIAFATVVYIGFLAVLFPCVIAKDYYWLYTASLVVIVGISTAAQYFFGITYQMLLEADQAAYIYSVIQIITVILNTIFVVITVKLGCSIQIVKLASAMFFVARPIILSMYTKRKYKILLDVPVNNNLIDQRWDAFAQGIAYFIHSKTDIFVLTVFATFSDVSIYSVYALVTTGLSSLINSIDKAVRSAFGNIIACDEKDTLRETFNAYNALVHMLTTTCFATASITVFAFVSVYVKAVEDANYIQPAFGILLITAEMMYCLRSPYNSIVYAAGKFKETKIAAGVEAGLNIVVSCALVPFWGLVGVAIGTLVAMTYRMISFANYLRRDILRFSIASQLKRYGITFFIYFFSIIVFYNIQYQPVTYLAWFIYAGCIFALVGLLTFFFNYIFDYKNTKGAVDMLLKRNREMINEE